MGAGRWFLRKNVYFCEQIITKPTAEILAEEIQTINKNNK